MKPIRTVLFAACIALAAALATAGECVPLKKTGTTYVYTNPTERVHIEAVSFTLNEADVTNTFSIDIVKDVVERVRGSRISTNLYGRVETNDWGLADTLVTFTTRVFEVTTTNVTTSQVYSRETVPPLIADFVIDIGDRAIFNWSGDTNALYWLIHKR